MTTARKGGGKASPAAKKPAEKASKTAEKRTGSAGKPVKSPAKSGDRRANAHARTRKEPGRAAKRIVEALTEAASLPPPLNPSAGVQAKPRRARIDTATAAVEVMQASLREIEPPGHIRFDADDWPFWDSVIAEFARSEWTNHQLEIAAFLAREMADNEKDQWLLRQEGPIVYTDKGTPVVNPRKSVVQMHAASILSYRRSLALHARGKGGEARDVGKRREATKAIENENPLSDDLLGGAGDALLAGPAAGRA